MEKVTSDIAVFATNDCERVFDNNHSTAACQACVNNSYWHRQHRFIYTSRLILMGEKTIRNHSIEETSQTSSSYETKPR